MTERRGLVDRIEALVRELEAEAVKHSALVAKYPGDLYPAANVAHDVSQACYSTIADRLTKLLAEDAGGWRGMDSAPRDGTRVLVYSREAAEPKVFGAQFLVFEGDPDPGDWYADDGELPVDVQLDAWQPLPPPPGARP